MIIDYVSSLHPVYKGRKTVAVVLVMVLLWAVNSALSICTGKCRTLLALQTEYIWTAALRTRRDDDIRWS